MIGYRNELRRYTPALYLDTLASRKRRRLYRVLLLAVAFGSALLFFFTRAESNVIDGTVFWKSYFIESDVYAGVFFIALANAVALYLVSFFYNTLYYRGIDSIVGESFTDDAGMTYEAAAIVRRDPADLTAAFLTSSYGKLVLARAGIDIPDVERFVARSDRTTLAAEALSLPESGFFTLETLGRFLHEHDAAFHQFILKRGKNDEMFRGALRWVSQSFLRDKYRTKWWSRDNLGKFNGLGSELSFGVAYELQKYMKPIATSAVFSLFSRDSAYANDLIEKIETALSRTKSANVMLVGEPGVGKMDILIELGRRMQGGSSASSILGKKLIVFDDDSFIATHNTKNEFEASFLKLFAQAEKAGNIIVVVENIAAFLGSIERLGSDASDLLDRFLASPNIQLVGTVDPDSYHDYVERKAQFISRFEQVLVEDPSLESSLRVLEGVAETHEAQFEVLFTFPAIAAIAEGADRYIVEGVMPDKAVSLLSDIAARASNEHVVVIKRAYVEAVVSEKTGVPLGPVNTAEKDKLLHLEEKLHERVIGQHSAIEAIASALRRSRAGIQSAERPLGTFLFLGSTGVGKTETAKALAAVFFGSEERMMRLDMTEYSGGDALGKLVGSAADAGTLPQMLRTHPYGVVLLDEFEKSSPAVHDMFLQILDEGVFTDGRGKRVNARNVIFIATSNAGSDIIWDMASHGSDPSGEKERIIDTIIERGTFKPELINRFDAVVIFKTLTRDEQRKIARLMLGELARRIEQKGYVLNVNDVLVDVLAARGYDPEFGARPMRRVLQDDIEEKIASKIIAGGLNYGDEIVFTEADFTPQPAPAATKP